MKITMFSVGPVFPGHVHGGSQKILREVASHLGAIGHPVTILCVQRPDNFAPFQLAPNVQVQPVLRLKPTYPEPYYTPPYNIAHLLRTVRTHMERSDVFYVHDAELPFPDLYRDIPTVFSFRDFVYPDTLVGAFGFRRDRLILNCEYVERCVTDAFAPILPDVASRIDVVRNGIDLSHFRPRGGAGAEELSAFLGHPPTADYTILYPHRPDGRKGIFEAIEITAAVVRRMATRGKTVRLLVPTWVDSAIAVASSHEYQSVYAEIRAAAATQGIASSVHFHDWVPYSLMPHYLSIGDVTLSVGNFVEAFGNVHLESVACGTPAIVARVAAHAYNLPEPVVRKVAHGDIAEAADTAMEVLLGEYDVDRARVLLAEQYSFRRMLDGYHEVLSAARIGAPLQVQCLAPLAADSHVRLAAWCRSDGKGIYNDYTYRRVSDSRRVRLASAATDVVQVARLQDLDFRFEEIEREVADGILVQLPSPQGCE